MSRFCRLNALGRDLAKRYAVRVQQHTDTTRSQPSIDDCAVFLHELASSTITSDPSPVFTRNLLPLRLTELQVSTLSLHRFSPEFVSVASQWLWSGARSYLFDEPHHFPPPDLLEILKPPRRTMVLGPVECNELQRLHNNKLLNAQSAMQFFYKWCFDVAAIRVDDIQQGRFDTIWFVVEHQSASVGRAATEYTLIEFTHALRATPEREHKSAFKSEPLDSLKQKHEAHFTVYTAPTTSGVAAAAIASKQNPYRAFWTSVGQTGSNPLDHPLSAWVHYMFQMSIDDTWRPTTHVSIASLGNGTHDVMALLYLQQRLDRHSSDEQDLDVRVLRKARIVELRQQFLVGVMSAVLLDPANQQDKDAFPTTDIPPKIVWLDGVAGSGKSWVLDQLRRRQADGDVALQNVVLCDTDQMTRDAYLVVRGRYESARLPPPTDPNGMRYADDAENKVLSDEVSAEANFKRDQLIRNSRGARAIVFVGLQVPILQPTARLFLIITKEIMDQVYERVSKRENEVRYKARSALQQRRQEISSGKVKSGMPKQFQRAWVPFDVEYLIGGAFRDTRQAYQNHYGHTFKRIRQEIGSQLQGVQQSQAQDKILELISQSDSQPQAPILATNKGGAAAQGSVDTKVDGSQANMDQTDDKQDDQKVAELPVATPLPVPPSPLLPPSSWPATDTPADLDEDAESQTWPITVTGSQLIPHSSATLKKFLADQHYKTGTYLKSGFVGSVYELVDTRTGAAVRDRVVKITPVRVEHEATREQMLQEGKAAEMAGAVNVGPRVYAYALCRISEVNHVLKTRTRTVVLCIVMDRLSGPTLDTVYPFQPNHITQVLQSHYNLLRNTGIEQNDPKPTNHMFDIVPSGNPDQGTAESPGPNARVVVIDYGLAQFSTTYKTWSEDEWAQFMLDRIALPLSRWLTTHASEINAVDLWYNDADEDHQLRNLLVLHQAIEAWFNKTFTHHDLLLPVWVNFTHYDQAREQLLKVRGGGRQAWLRNKSELSADLLSSALSQLTPAAALATKAPGAADDTTTHRSTGEPETTAHMAVDEDDVDVEIATDDS